MREKELVIKTLKELKKLVQSDFDVNRFLWCFSVIYFITNKYESSIKSFLNDEYIKSEQKLKQLEEQGKDKEFICYYQQEPRTSGIHDLIQGKHLTPLILWYLDNKDDITLFKNIITKKFFIYIPPQYLWSNIRKEKDVYVLNRLILDSSIHIYTDIE